MHLLSHVIMTEREQLLSRMKTNQIRGEQKGRVQWKEAKNRCHKGFPPSYLQQRDAYYYYS